MGFQSAITKPVSVAEYICTGGRAGHAQTCCINLLNKTTLPNTSGSKGNSCQNKSIKLKHNETASLLSDEDYYSEIVLEESDQEVIL